MVVYFLTFLDIFENAHFASQEPPLAAVGPPFSSKSHLRRTGSPMNLRSTWAGALRGSVDTLADIHSPVWKREGARILVRSTLAIPSAKS